jgi:hypothetical protein
MPSALYHGIGIHRLCSPAGYHVELWREMATEKGMQSGVAGQ